MGIIFIIALVVSTKLVDGAYQMYMKMIGASSMRYSAGKKIIAIVVVAYIITAIIMSIFGIQV